MVYSDNVMLLSHTEGKKLLFFYGFFFKIVLFELSAQAGFEP
jgi:hypothetical protein